MTVFICYGREDEASARRLRDELIGSGYKVWFDKESLLAGQLWNEAIVEAIRSADAVCAVLSRSSVGRKGFANREITEALRVVDELPESRPFLIPVRLDDCEPSHRRLSELHRVDMFPDWADGRRQILKALRAAGSARGTATAARAFIQIRLDGRDVSETVAALKKVPGMISVDVTLGHFDVMAVLAATKGEDLADRVAKLHAITGVGSTSTHLIVPRDDV